MTKEVPEVRCRRYRRRILEIARTVPAAHVAPAFSCLEIVDALYHGVMRLEKDIFIMSKGHGWLAQLVVLEDLGIIPARALDAYYCRSPDPGVIDALPSFGAHPDRDPGLGIHASTGSLGHGLGIAAGMAHAELLRDSGVRVYVLLSDGECQSGATWEAVMVAANLELYNLRVVVDYNDFGGMDRISAAHPNLAPLVDKFEAFGWVAVDCPGHVEGDITHVLSALKHQKRSTAVVCRTIKGRGVSFMENDPIWHYRSPVGAEYERAISELSDGSARR